MHIIKHMHTNLHTRTFIYIPRITLFHKDIQNAFPLLQDPSLKKAPWPAGLIMLNASEEILAQDCHSPEIRISPSHSSRAT